MSLQLTDLIKRGGLFSDVEGGTPAEVYKNVIGMMNLPASINGDVVYRELCHREELMSTAVGNGIAIPHSRSPIVKDDAEQRVCVVYLKNPIDMNAPDLQKVSVMFIILSHTLTKHLYILSLLGILFRDEHFRNLLEKKSDMDTLLRAIEESPACHQEETEERNRTKKSETN